MKNKKIIIFCIILAAVCLLVCAFVLKKPVQKTLVLTEGAFASFNGTDYVLWKDSGDVKMVLDSSGTYECEWKNTHDAIFRTGRRFNPSRPVSSREEIQLDYGAEYKPEGTSFLGAYGWMENPLIEFYIVENWGTVRPDDRQDVFEKHVWLGAYTVNDAEYDVYLSVRENKPSINDVKETFRQYWSVRRVPSSEGTICVSDHFKIWESAGLSLGELSEISFAVEGIESSGYAEVYRNELTFNPSSSAFRPQL